MSLTITPLPAFRDNYIWTLHDERYAVVVDPGDAAPVLAFLKARQLELVAILVTHHHHDHTDGIADLLAAIPVCVVYGPRHETIAGVSHPVSENEVIEIPALDLSLTVWDIPGHTRGHIAYLGADGVFCGDTLFGAGCGRLFEGSYAQLHHALNRLAALPAETRVYCTHEYTEANVRFALACEPDNPDIRRRQIATAALRAAGQPSLPSTIALENASNPFLRCAVPAVIQHAEAHAGHILSDELAVFTALRQWRNNF
ncbi:Hydroxyacylglutathione hydrolase [Ferriphaselus amnicola]|uniref:Hydroxyacylglutathione hydrolase n=1 Tax=Ferriphaselus amnicola TaxID=1188319 RepID=A0A2Z6GA60_9PROT|nr:hydroxyacylglutathione hydrolase [Ferriphaselus amnicola]BBE50284.1 Hydroxyacylglutathione hydrolase [Ferriphaselus amnicola]